MEKQSKKILMTGVQLLSAFGVFAQGKGLAGITEATQVVTSYFDPATQYLSHLWGGQSSSAITGNGIVKSVRKLNGLGFTQDCRVVGQEPFRRNGFQFSRFAEK